MLRFPLMRKWERHSKASAARPVQSLIPSVSTLRCPKCLSSAKTRVLPRSTVAHRVPGLSACPTSRPSRRQRRKTAGRWRNVTAITEFHPRWLHSAAFSISELFGTDPGAASLLSLRYGRRSAGSIDWRCFAGRGRSYYSDRGCSCKNRNIRMMRIPRQGSKTSRS